jgi:hypothetical protein
MTDKIEDAAPPVAESREGKRARQIKAEIMELLEDVADVMTRATAEGFGVEFSVQTDAEGKSFINNDLVKIIKRW